MSLSPMTRVVLSAVMSSFVLTGVYCQNVSLLEKEMAVYLSNATRNVNVTLSCIGSNANLFYYVSNRLIWSMVSRSAVNNDIALTNGLLATFKDHYNLDYREVATGCKFDLTIIGVNRSDDGKYKCSQKITNGTVTDSKELILTVINSVETLKLQLYNDINLIKEVTTLEKSALKLEIKPGNYKVVCFANGSNPAPLMKLLVQDIPQAVSVHQKQVVINNVISYTGFYEANVHLEAHTNSQSIVCKATLPHPHNLYPKMAAGLEVMIWIVKPNISCSTLTAYENQYNQTIECNMTITQSSTILVCSEVMWRIGDINKELGSMEIWTDIQADNATIQTLCQPDNDGRSLHVMLTFFEMKAKYFKSMFHVIYGIVDHPLEIYLMEIVVGSQLSSTATLISGFVYLAIATIVTMLFGRYY